MEFMLMPDGSVRVFPKVFGVDTVQQMLREHGGSAYYYKNLLGWYTITSEHNYSCPAGDTVPDVVKLAALLV